MMRMFGIIGRKAEYESLSWWENFLGGHVSIGNVTIYGANAMNWAVNIYTKRWGYVCFSLPSIGRVKAKMGRYFYLSPNATPWACTYYRGVDKNEKIRAEIRRMNFGHGFKVNDESTYQRLRALNEKFEWFMVNDYDMTRFGKSND